MMDDLMRRIPRRIVRVALPGLFIFVICLGILVSMHSAGARDDTQLPLDGNLSLLLDDNQSPLSGRSWHLTSYWTGETAVSVIEKTDPVIAFTDDGQISGTSGCNIFFGNYNLADGRLTIRKIESTNMTSISEAVNQEEAFFTLLQKTEAYRVDGNRLRLFDASGREVLSFTSQTQPLQGRAWYLWYPEDDTEGTGQDTTSDLISLQLLDGDQLQGTVAGSDYCGTYEADEDSIRFRLSKECPKVSNGRTDLCEWYYSLLKQAYGYRGSTRYHE